MEASRTKSRSPSKGKHHTRYNESELQSLTTKNLKTMCQQDCIDLSRTTTKQTIIDRMMGLTNPPESASARAASPGRLHFTKTASAKRTPSKRQEMDKDDPQTPTTPESNLRVGEFDKKDNVWFRTEFLKAALETRLDQSKGVGRENPSPTLFILVGPASVGKSSAKSLIPELTGVMSNYVVNVDVDEIKLYGNDVLPKHPNQKKPGEMLSDVEGIQFNYDMVLEKLRPMVFQNVTEFGKGQYKNIILDTTGSMINQIKMYIRMAKQTYEYTVKVIIVYSDKTQCLERVQSRNRILFEKGQGTRYIPPRVVNSIYDTFLEKNQAYFYALGPRMPELTDELIFVDNRTQPKIIARRQPGTGLKIFPDGEHTLVGVDGAFYGLTLNPPQASQPASIVQGNIDTAIEKAEREWADFQAAAAASKHSGHGGSSRKRRISRRRIHGIRAKKTIKKYTRPVTRRRRNRRRRDI